MNNTTATHKTMPSQWTPLRQEIHDMKPGEVLNYGPKDCGTARAAVKALNYAAGVELWTFVSKNKEAVVTRLL